VIAGESTSSFKEQAMITQSKERVAVDLEFTDGCQIAVITLVDTARDNAMSPEMGDAFRVVVDSLKTFSDLRCAIVRGAGKNFSIGGARDMLSSLADTRRTAEDRERFMLGFYDRWLTLLDIPVPVIAAIEGECIGVAPIFACASDIAIADDTARFQITFTALGLFPGMAMAHLMPRCAGRQHAALAMLAGAAFSGREAAEWGLVARSMPAGRVQEEAIAIARQIAANAPETTRDLARTLRVKRAELQPVLERDGRKQAESYGSAEFRKRIAAYLPEHYDAA
jgi:enoyl-CoA hydratase/carnithine racemase